MPDVPRTVCVPRLSIAALALVRARFGRGTRVLFEFHPLYMKALLRWAHVPKHVLTRLLSALFSLHVEAFRTRVRPASGFAAMLRVAEVTDALEPRAARPAPGSSDGDEAVVQRPAAFFVSSCTCAGAAAVETPAARSRWCGARTGPKAGSKPSPRPPRPGASPSSAGRAGTARPTARPGISAGAYSRSPRSSVRWHASAAGRRRSGAWFPSWWKSSKRRG